MVKRKKDLFFWETIRIPYKRKRRRLTSEIDKPKKIKIKKSSREVRRKKIISLIKVDLNDCKLIEYLQETDKSCLNNENYLDVQVTDNRLKSFSNL